jgi:Dolichyl-phosphate-mannose-protein mannosyltransferase
LVTADPVPSRTTTPAATPPRLRAGADAGAAAWRRALPAIAVFTVARVAGVAVLTLWAHRRGDHPRDLLGLEWDGLWYHRIADWGYGTFIPSWEAPGLRYDDLAFFPLYPMTVRAADAVLPVGSVACALLVAWVCAVVAAWGIFAATEHCYGRRTATVCVLLWGLLPHAVVLSMAYTEPMMTALAAWALYAALTHRWLTAGLLSSLAGLSRPNAVAVTAAVAAAVLADARHRRRTHRPQHPRAWLGLLIAPLGWCGYVLWVGLQTGPTGMPTGTPGGGLRGALSGYFEVQRRWGSEFDFGHYALHYVKHLALFPDTLSAYVATTLCALAVLLLALAAFDRMPLPLLVYAAALVVIALGGANFFSCKPRFLLPAFPLLIPCAAALAKARPRVTAPAVVALTGISLGYGAYVLTVVTVPV